MADETKKPEQPQAADPNQQNAAPQAKGPVAAEKEREELLKAITAIEHENKTIMGLLTSCSPRTVKELQDQNKELKERIIAAEKALAIELLGRKTPIDAAGCTDRMTVLKADVLAYCHDRKISETIWKKLESL